MKKNLIQIIVASIIIISIILIASYFIVDKVNWYLVNSGLDILVLFLIFRSLVTSEDALSSSRRNNNYNNHLNVFEFYNELSEKPIYPLRFKDCTIKNIYSTYIQSFKSISNQIHEKGEVTVLRITNYEVKKFEDFEVLTERAKNLLKNIQNEIDLIKSNLGEHSDETEKFLNLYKDIILIDYIKLCEKIHEEYIFIKDAEENDVKVHPDFDHPLFFLTKNDSLFNIDEFCSLYNSLT